MRAEDLNAAVKELAGDRFTCKDLRTWNATVLAAVTLAAGVAQGGVPTAERTRKRVANRAIKQVAEHLGNTPTVARASYVDPRVLDRFAGGPHGADRAAPAGRRPTAVPDLTDDATRAALDRAVVRLLRS